MRKSRFPHLVTMFLGAALLAALTVGLNGCGGGASGNSKDLTFGFVYIGPKDDYGYSQAHAHGAAAVKKLPDVKVLEQEKVLPLTRFRQAAGRSHIALGVYYAREGLMDEAEREFAALAQANADSTLARSLLQSVRSLRGS